MDEVDGFEVQRKPWLVILEELLFGIKSVKKA